MVVAHAWDPVHALVAAVGSLVPDLDHPRSIISYLILRPIERMTFIPVRRIIGLALGHRGPLHWPIPWALASLLAFLTGHDLLAAVLLGALLHCLEDALTTRGVPFFPVLTPVPSLVNLRLTPIPSYVWDKVLPPSTLAVVAVALVWNPGAELHRLGLDLLLKPLSKFVHPHTSEVGIVEKVRGALHGVEVKIGKAVS